jgi:hypothetical protein
MRALFLFNYEILLQFMNNVKREIGKERGQRKRS